MNALSTMPSVLLVLMLGAVSAGTLYYNLWVWLHRRNDTLQLWAAGWCAITGREPFQLDPEDERLLESFGAQAALAIRNASLYAAEGAARQAAERALAEVTRLQGMLPICSYCKKIRNDQNSWEQLERYISEHSHATFSHGICPDCRTPVVARELEQWRRAR